MDSIALKTGTGSREGTTSDAHDDERSQASGQVHSRSEADPGIVSSSGVTFDVSHVRSEFPSLAQEVRPGVPLIYLDSAATSLKPWPVVRAVGEYLGVYPANVHRGLHSLSERATDAFETARQTVARFLGVNDPSLIVFTRGTTDAINLVAQSWGRSFIRAGEEIVVSELEHHSNLVPWQMLAHDRGVVLRYAEITDDGRLEFESLERAVTDKTRLIAVTGMSNVTGAIPPLERIVAMAHAHGAKVLVDAAQSLPHGRLDAASLGVDFVAFSGHKICGPTGVGVLYARRELLESMPPVSGGGNMVSRVDRDGAEWNEAPWKFEAGTPAIAEAIGLGAALEYLERFSPAELEAHERSLLMHAHKRLGEIEGFKLVGPSSVENKGAIVSFTLDGIHPHDLAQLLDRHGIAIRAGHHCTMPLHTRLGLLASARASFYLYNTIDEVDRLAEALESIKILFRRR